jgi:hypothetical protein
MTRSPSSRVTGFDRMCYAMMYFRIGRVRQLLIDCQNPTKNMDFTIFDQDYYKRNLVVLITESNFPTNIHYSSNKGLYEKLFFTILNNIEEKNLKQLFLDACEFETPWNTKLVQEIFKNLSDRPHILIALWNYGLKYSEANVNDMKNDKLKTLLLKHVDDEFESKKRYHLLNQTCPIGLQLINTPAILTDGTIYEYDLIKSHLRLHDTNPLTNECLMCESRSICYEDENGDWKYKLVSAKILYLPETNSFEHFELINKK